MASIGKIAIIDDKHKALSLFFTKMTYDPDGHGKEVVLRLMRVKTMYDFFNEVDEFATSNGLPDKIGGEVLNTPPFDFRNYNVIMMDYLYVKNLSCEVQTIIDINGKNVSIQPNQIMVFHDGMLEPFAVEVAVQGGTDIDCDTFTNLLTALNKCTTEDQVKELALAVPVEDPILAGLYQESVSIKLKELEDKKNA